MLVLLLSTLSVLVSISMLNSVYAQENMTNKNITNQEFKFKYKQGAGTLGQDHNKTVLYNSDSNQLTVIGTNYSYGKQLSTIIEHDLKNMILENNFFKMPKAWPTQLILAEYNSYNLTAIINNQSNTVYWIEEFTSAPNEIYEIGNKIEKISSPILYLSTNKDIYNINEVINLTITNYGDKILQFADKNFGLRILNSDSGEIVCCTYNYSVSTELNKSESKVILFNNTSNLNKGKYIGNIVSDSVFASTNFRVQ
ncbi:MAG: hypothetical protein ACPKPY_09905 [Nitrososphaeraceae archaeon]